VPRVAVHPCAVLLCMPGQWCLPGVAAGGGHTKGMSEHDEGGNVRVVSADTGKADAKLAAAGAAVAELAEGRRRPRDHAAGADGWTLESSVRMRGEPLRLRREGGCGAD